MISRKKILILCDAHDFIRNETNNMILLKQLYVTVFLLKKICAVNKNTLTLNNRAINDFETFWKAKGTTSSFLKKYTINKSWNDLDMPSYDIIICHPEYQKNLQNFILKNYGSENSLKIFSLSEVQYKCEMIYPSVGSLFLKGGLFELEKNDKNNTSLLEFKRKLDRSFVNFTAREQELTIPELEELASNFNNKLQLDEFDNILILDDYFRAVFIGDSLFWLRKLKMLIDFFPKDCYVTINITNPAAFRIIHDSFKNSLPDRISVTNFDWQKLSIEKFDLILCNNDILLKFYWYLQSSSINGERPLFYTFSATNERQTSKKPTLNFYTNILFSAYSYKLKKMETKRHKNIYNEIALTMDENSWADNWLKSKGIIDSDKIFVLLHGSSSSKKVIDDLELLKFIKFLTGLKECLKILLISEKSLSNNKWLDGALTNFGYNKIVVAEALELRQAMSLLGNKKVAAIIGPCTGLMHIADGIYTSLLNHSVISESSCPLLLTYCGRQESERFYHPNNWWSEVRVTYCFVCMQDKSKKKLKKLISLAECPSDYETFFKQSVNAREISSTMLAKILTDQFPDFIYKLIEPNGSNTPLYFHNIDYVRKPIPTFIINLKRRVDRRSHILEQFTSKPVFDVILVDAIESENGKLGLWLTIKKIVSESLLSDHEYILICEDDHEFTEYYSDQLLLSCINDSKNLNADVLLGGIGSVDTGDRLHKNLVSVDNFACTQFTIIFKSFFKKVIKAEFTENDCADWKIASLSNKKLVVYPFISKQKDFGYSDVSDGYFDNKMETAFNVTSEIIKNIMSC